MVQAPIFHVNGDDPEAVLFVSQLAVDYRQTFNKDVVIDLVCYRRRGHNEADEPSGTQPLMYQKIKSQRSTRDLYAETLIAENVVDKAGDNGLIDSYRTALESGEHVAKSLIHEPNEKLFVDWTPYLGHDNDCPSDTRIDLKAMQELAAKVNHVPEGFPIQKQVAKIYEDRHKMAAGGTPINWGFAEVLAYASIVDAGQSVRLTGQDVGRGTFSHRHAVLHNQSDASVHVPLQHIDEEQPSFTIHDSLLSEEAVLAFEYGLSLIHI